MKDILILSIYSVSVRRDFKLRGYRFVTNDLKSKHDEVQWQLGKWQKHDGKLMFCKSEFHASKEANAVFFNKIKNCKSWKELFADESLLKTIEQYAESALHYKTKLLAIKFLLAAGAKIVAIECKLLQNRRYSYDVVGWFSYRKLIVVECGNFNNFKTTEELNKTFVDKIKIIHFPYCNTPDLLFKTPQMLLKEIKQLLKD